MSTLNNPAEFAADIVDRMVNVYALADTSNPPNLLNNWGSAARYIIYFLERGWRLG